jgi:membrane-bound lytic murein transglycosylase D
MIHRVSILILLLFFFSFTAYSQECGSSPLWNEENLQWVRKNRPFPEEANQRIEYFLKKFQTKDKKYFVQSLEEGNKYLPLMKEIFQKTAVPEDLVYIAMIESGFNHHANYRMTCGLWQFTPATARKYGLKINPWIDERKNPEKSTLAAAHYLKDLYEEFGCWCLALAGYNAGEESIRKALKRYGTNDFWYFKDDGYLNKVTLNYVPKSIAAALIARDPEKYGISIQSHKTPLAHEKVRISQPTDLRDIARIADIDLRELKSLNPSLKTLSTPPEYPEYRLNVPYGKKATVEKYLENFYLTRRENIEPAQDSFSSRAQE